MRYLTRIFIFEFNKIPSHMRVIICTSLLDLASDFAPGSFFQPREDSPDCLIKSNPVYRHIRLKIRTIGDDGDAAHVGGGEVLRHRVMGWLEIGQGQPD